jgi:hypothetical protein
MLRGRVSRLNAARFRFTLRGISEMPASQPALHAMPK